MAVALEVTDVWRFFYKSLTAAGTFFSGRLSGGDRCMEVTVNRGSTVCINSLDTNVVRTDHIDKIRYFEF